MMCRTVARLVGPASLCASLLVAAIALAEPTKLVLIPIGEGNALEPTTLVTQALASRLQRPGQRTTALAYFAPEQPEPADLKAQEKNAAKALKKAFASYETMEYEKVKEQAAEALKIYKALLKSHPSGNAEGYLTCLHLLAASALLQGESREAFQNMNDAVLFDPRPPSKRLFNPSVQELYEQVRAEPSPNGTIILRSTPPAFAWFNGNLRGLARGRVTLRSGLYLVRFYAPGNTAVQRWVRVQAHQERSLTVSLTADGQPEHETMVRLREESLAAEPGAAISQAALDLNADEVILVGAEKTCTAARCAIRLAWVRDGRWYRRRDIIHGGQPDVTAAALTGSRLTTPTAVPPTPGMVITDGARACTLDNQCFMDERCRNGRCVKPRPVTRTWWFWTIIGAATAGVTLAIVLPLTRPEGPVIEVR